MDQLWELIIIRACYNFCNDKYGKSITQAAIQHMLDLHFIEVYKLSEKYALGVREQI